MESLRKTSSVVDIYRAVTSIAELRKLALRFPGRSVYAKLVGRVYRWKRVRKLQSVEEAFVAHQQYTLDKLEESMPCEDNDEAEDEFPDSNAEENEVSPLPKRRAMIRRYAPASSSSPSVHARYGASSISRRNIIRDVIGEVLPALLQQQKSLVSSAISSMRAASTDEASDTDDTHIRALSYGCRSCETLQRRLLQMEAEQASLRAELERMRHAQDTDKRKQPLHSPDVFAVANTLDLTGRPVQTDVWSMLSGRYFARIPYPLWGEPTSLHWVVELGYVRSV